MPRTRQTLKRAVAEFRRRPWKKAWKGRSGKRASAGAAGKTALKADSKTTDVKGDRIGGEIDCWFC
jgi:hypothetical protein